MSICKPNPQDSIATDRLDADADQDELVTAVNRLAELVEQQQETIDDQQETIGELRERVSELEERQANQAKESAQDRQRLTDVENRLDDVEEGTQPQGSDPTDDDGDDSVTPQTPLEQTARLPDDMVADETANVRRAIFVAKDVHDYTKKVPAGRAIRSSELRTVLQAGTDAEGHSQTVERVMTILDDMGRDDVEIVDRRGERRVVFSDSITERLQRVTNQQDAVEDTNHGVVTPVGD